MVSYNPNSPCTTGLEWRPSRASAGVLDNDNKAIGLVLTADTSDTIDEFWAFIRTLAGTDGILTLEVYDLTAVGGVIPQPALSTNVYYPSSDLFIASPPWVPGSLGAHTGYTLLDASVVTAWKALDSTTLTPMALPSGAIADNNEFIANFFGEGYDFAVRFADVSGSLTGRWITRVTSRALVAQYYDFDTPPGNMVRPYLWIAGRRYWGNSETIIAAQGAKEIVFSWYLNPDDGLPWVPGVVNQFDTTDVGPSGGMGLGWVSYPTHSANNITTILQGQLWVESAGSDPRMAIGSTGNTRLSLPGWHSIDILDPADASASTITLVPGNQYLFNLRRSTARPGAVANIGLGRLEDIEQVLPGPPTWVSTLPTLDETTRRIIDVGETSKQAYGVVLAGSGTPSLDSQPYATASRLDGIDAFPSLNEYYDNSPVHTGLSLRQRFTAPSTDTYPWLFILVAQYSEASDGDLSIQVRKVSDDSAVGSPFIITSTDLELPRHSWQKIGVRNPGTSPALVNGTQYYFDITSTATAAKGWLVQVLNELQGSPPYGPPAGSSAANFGGTSNRAYTGAGLTGQDEMDVVVSIATIPDTPTGLVATASSQVCCMSHINLVWDTVEEPECAGFALIEVQRRDTPTSEWLTIAEVTDINVVSIEDWESLRNIEASYRMRVVRGDGAPSDWSTTATATAPMTTCTGLMFTSNVAPDMSVFYQDLGQQRKISFPANYDEFQPHGRDGTVVFGELEDRLRRFGAQLRVRAGQVPCLPACDDPDGLGSDVFGPLRSIGRASLPYVCVHNESGNRFYANVRTPEGMWEQHGLERVGGFAAYLMEIEVVEETNVPSPFDQIAGS